MKVAFPSNENKGLESEVYNHFGSAKVFVIVETDDGAFDVLFNQDLNHQHNNCQPLKALGGTTVDAVVVGGIGGGALRKLNAAGVKVFRAVPGDVKANLDLFKGGKMSEYLPEHTCSGHGPDGECSH